MRLALAGDTMLGRQVGARLANRPEAELFSDEVAAITAEADLCVVNLECAISDRGSRWPDPDKPFFFRGPPAAVDVLSHLGVDCVTLANNHALDYGPDALVDTLRRLDGAGIPAAGAGVDDTSARRPVVLESAGQRVAVVGVTDHPYDFAAGPDHPGVAYADLYRGVPAWLVDEIGAVAAAADVVVVMPHWGPNMVAEPVGHVRRAAAAFREAGATLVAGHSAHVFHGIGDDRVLFDLGDFVDDYAVDPVLRNDLGLLFVVTFDGPDPVRVEAVPLALDYCYTRLAVGDERTWVADRFRQACERLGTEVVERDGRLVVAWQPAGGAGVERAATEPVEQDGAQ